MNAVPKEQAEMRDKGILIFCNIYTAHILHNCGLSSTFKTCSNLKIEGSISFVAHEFCIQTKSKHLSSINIINQEVSLDK